MTSYKQKMTEFAKQPRINISKKRRQKAFDKLLDKEFLNNYFTINNQSKNE